jgi:hypothetical protein
MAEDETAGRFRVGQKVRLSDKGRNMFTHQLASTGVIVRIQRRNPEILVIRRDGRTQDTAFHHTFWEPDEPASTI